MAINLSEKYEKKVQERFSIGSKTDNSAGHDYEFTGVKTIHVYMVDTVQTVAYTRSGTARFGTLTELGDSVQEMSLAKDMGFTFSIDAGNASEQFNIKQANACLKREIDEVITPEIDKYRLASWSSGRGLSSGKTILTQEESAALTSSSIVEAIFTANATMSDNLVPATGRTLFIPEMTFVLFKLSSVVMGIDSVGAENIRRGYRGTIDGVDVVTVPSSLFPAGINFILKHKNATVDPMKLKNYRIHKNPMGVDGDVVEGRYIYDSFVLDSKAKGVLISKTASGD